MTTLAGIQIPVLEAIPLEHYLVFYGEKYSPLGALLLPDNHEKVHRDGRIPNELWERIVPLLPPCKPHPWRVPPASR
jgi:hypothetical protein